MRKACSNSIVEFDLSKCTPIGLELAEWAAIIGTLVILLGTLRFAFKPIARIFLRSRTENVPSFDDLTKSIKPYVLENRRIFETFGPRSARTAKEPEKFDLPTWYNARLEIGTNNSKILKLIYKHSNVIPKQWEASFEAWKNHITAFQAHIDNPHVSYKHHQYPKDIDDLFNL